ncbi:unnamed protein product [Auanema sp. JU1783]|nr:unnamed protein product [Auanema sp. JU1783]
MESHNLTCKNGIIIGALDVSPRNALIYLAGLLYCFLGIAIAADIFMCAIERITSATKRVKKTKEHKQLVDNNQVDDSEFEEVQIWNPTVANLTLMALGSSAPEILLSIIEIVGNGFKAGDLGPGTIVGSAAFNLFCISAICIVSVKNSEVKRIEMFRVFVVTAFFGTFAYVWLVIILSLISPNVIEIWEALLTLVFFGILVTMAYLADIEVWKSKKANLEVELETMDDKRSSANQLDVHIKQYASQASLQPDGSRVIGKLPTPSFEEVKKLSRDVSRTYPMLSSEDQALILAYRLKQNTKHNRLFYRIRAVRCMSSSFNRSEEECDVHNLLKKAERIESDGRVKPMIEFSARVYAVESSDKQVTLTILRKGSCQYPLTVNYQTVNGLAKRDLHFLAKSESVRFVSGETEKDIHITLVEGADWRPNHVFYVHLKIEDQDEADSVKLGPAAVARVRYPDDTASLMGEAGVEFVRANYVVSENCGFARVFVSRRGSIRKGKCTISYETLDITAQQKFDYMPIADGKLQFDGYEYEKYIDVEILDDKQDEKDETFMIELLNISNSEISIGKNKKTIVTIISDDNLLKNVTNVRKLLGHYMRKMTPGQRTWKEQILNATSVNAGDLANATLSDCILHALAFPWKFTFAFIPPPSLLGGWLCFLVSLAVIGVITAVVGDLASIFGCMVGMRDAVTAITLVAIGTSLPDTFASKIAAENDATADNAVGNVTGSNSVNVFLGLGLPWLVASIYWTAKGEPFEVMAGSVVNSVIIFTICSILFLAMLILRRSQAIFGKGELGGPGVPKILCGVFSFVLWITYVAISTLLS